MRTLSPKRRSALSLIEILTATGIIMLLAALILPAVKSMNARAMEARATSNLRQLAAAQFQYAAENNQTYTPAWSSTNPVSWQGALKPYLYPNDNGPTWSALRQDPKSVFNVPDAKFPATGGYCSIGLNAYLSANNTSNPARSWNYRALAVPRPSSIILLGEMVPKNNEFVQPPNLSLGGSAPGFRRANNTRALVAFCDGHVAALNTTELSQTQSTPQNPWFWW